MSQPYIGEIRLVGFNYEPVGWAFCDGRTLPIAGNEALFQLIGTTYGGDGQATFQLPNLQSRVPMHFGTAATGTVYAQGQTGGVEQVTLTQQQIPQHSHRFTTSQNGGTDPNPQGNAIGSPPTLTMFINDTPNVSLHPQSLTSAGGTQPHDNLQPLLVVNFVIALQGIYPSKT
jgi:microcystin-dependent protein